jgi:L-alanine-DL-glutamate epimerase-like enolase superfamily enzyme
MTRNETAKTLVKLRSLRRLRLPLLRPYHLAFGPVDYFDTILVSLDLGQEAGHGEATILTGYTEETIEESWTLARRFAEEIDESPLPAAETLLLSQLKEAPFTVTAFYTAIEMALRHKTLAQPQTRRMPLVKLLHAMEEPEIQEEVEQAICEGYQTIKVKAGFDAERDYERVRKIQAAAGGRLAITVDANQGFTREEGVHFASRLRSPGILFFEQACHKDDWEAAVAVARSSTIPMMLDESIYSLDDIRRAATLRAAAFVKVKLMKFGSLRLLEEGLAEISALGLQPVLGNGVAADVGCWMEACAGAGRLTAAGEMNGFLKLRYPLVKTPLRVEAGSAVIPGGYWPVLDQDAIERQTVDILEL